MFIPPQTLQPPSYVFWFHNTRMINYDRIRGGITVSTRQLTINHTTTTTTTAETVASGVQISASANHSPFLTNVNALSANQKPPHHRDASSEDATNQNNHHRYKKSDGTLSTNQITRYRKTSSDDANQNSHHRYTKKSDDTLSKIQINRHRKTSSENASSTNKNSHHRYTKKKSDDTSSTNQITRHRKTSSVNAASTNQKIYRHRDKALSTNQKGRRRDKTPDDVTESFNVKLDGNGAKNGARNGAKNVRLTVSELLITEAAIADSGDYTCSAENTNSTVHIYVSEGACFFCVFLNVFFC